MTTCDRCGALARVSIGSMFNTEQICMDCEREEREHPEYERAREEEAKRTLAGNYNYPGIGLPDDLRARARERKAAREA